MRLAIGTSNPNLTFLIFGVGNVSIASKHQTSHLVKNKTGLNDRYFANFGIFGRASL